MTPQDELVALLLQFTEDNKLTWKWNFLSSSQYKTNLLTGEKIIVSQRKSSERGYYAICTVDGVIVKDSAVEINRLYHLILDKEKAPLRAHSEGVIQKALESLRKLK